MHTIFFWAGEVLQPANFLALVFCKSPKEFPMYDTTHDKKSLLGLLSAQSFNDSHVIIVIAINSVSQMWVINAITTTPQEPEDGAYPCVVPIQIVEILFEIQTSVP